jgi:hypothetical protein
LIAFGLALKKDTFSCFFLVVVAVVVLMVMAVRIALVLCFFHIQIH